MEIDKAIDKLAILGNFDFVKIEDSTPTKNAQIREHLAATSKERRSKNRFRFGSVEITIDHDSPIKGVDVTEYIRVSICNPATDVDVIFVAKVEDVALIKRAMAE